MVKHHVEVKDKRYLVTQDNYLVDIDSWDSDIRDWLAERADLQLSDERLSAIDFIRKTYFKRKQHPNPRVIMANHAGSYGQDKGTLRYFYQLFPKGVQQAFAVAGVPMQGFCF